MDREKGSLKQYLKARGRACACFAAVTAALALCGLAGDARLEAETTYHAVSGSDEGAAQAEGAGGEARSEAAAGEPRTEGAGGEARSGGAAGEPRTEGAGGEARSGGAAGEPRTEGAGGEARSEAAAGEPQMEGAGGEARSEAAAGEPQMEGAGGEARSGGAAGEAQSEGAGGEVRSGGAAGEPRTEGAGGEARAGGAAGEPRTEGAGGEKAADSRRPADGDRRDGGQAAGEDGLGADGQGDGTAGAGASGMNGVGAPGGAITLHPDEKALLDQLIRPLKERDMEAAAEILNQNETKFKELFFNTFDAAPCLYDGVTASTSLEGSGIVFKKATTVFYGAFEDGKPSGKMLVIQALQLDAPRYDYADGVWKDGHMEGFGTIGYDYYEGIEGEEAKETIKQGNFSKDLMEGEIVYINTDSEGNSASWHFAVSDGKLRTDERWTYDEESKVFSLISDDDESHAFVADEGSLSDVQWRNMITWNEGE